jgi:hypothetical protein
MSHLFASVQSAFDHQQAEFLDVELATCSRSANLASKMYKAGNTVAAERIIADAEKCYAMALRLLSDPKDSKYLTVNAIYEFTAKMEALRIKLDGLSRMGSTAGRFPEK